MSVNIESFDLPELLPEADSLWVERQKIDSDGMYIDFDRTISGDRNHNNALTREVIKNLGEPLPMIAQIQAGRSSFAVMDTRESDQYQTPFLLWQDNVRRGGFKGIWPDTELLVGRHHQQQRFSYDSQVSGNHFSLHFDSETDRLQLKDLDSTNGTSVSGYILDAFREQNQEGLRAIYTDNVQSDLFGRHDYGEIDDVAPHGYDRNHPIIGRLSRTVRNGIYGTTHSESVVVDDKSRIIREALMSFGDKLLDLGDSPTVNTRQVLHIAKGHAAELLRYDLDRVNAMSEPLYDNRGLIGLSEYLRAGVGVCRHQALLVGLFIEAAIDIGVLEGSVGVERNADSIQQSGHAWAVYRDASDQEVIVDATNNFVGTREEGSNKVGWRYYLPVQS